MKSRKLTVAIKDSIVDSLAASWKAANKEPEVQDTRAKLKQQLAVACHKETYKKYDFSNIPEEFLNTRSCIRVQMPDGGVEIANFGKDEEGKTIYLPSTRESKVEYVISKSDSFYKDYKQKLEVLKKEVEKRNEYESSLHKFQAQVRQTLDSVNTTKQLVEVWPEVEEHLPESVKDPSKIQLPSVNIQSLNEQLK